MENWVQAIGIILLAVFSIIFIVLVVIAARWILQLVVGILTALYEHRQHEAKRVTMTVAGLGEFSSIDNRVWTGHVEDIQVSIDTDGGPPTEDHVRLVGTILEGMPHTAEMGRQFLGDHEECEWLEGGSALFQPEMLDCIDDTRNFWLTFGHPADSDGMYGVEFIDGQPVSSKRDD